MSELADIDALVGPDPMPVLFLGHGSPMNAIAHNAFTQSLSALGARLPAPRAVLAVSAHWMTPGRVDVLSSAAPRTIHDFYGFPPELYAIDYPAPGAPAIAREVAETTGARLDETWGLDHGTWSVLRHVFPAADVPVFQLSLDVAASPQAHVELAREIAWLRDRGVLVVGSGNIVHNLGRIDWADDAQPYEWTVSFDAWVADRLAEGDVDALARYADRGVEARLAVPTNDHYLPMLYAAALRRDGEPLEFVYEGLEMGSLSMRCFLIG